MEPDNQGHQGVAIMARLAKALERLRLEIDTDYPLRNKSSDGWIGDAAHRATKSEHNPNSAGVVTAIDITHDPAHGCDNNKIVNDLVLSRDGRMFYLIWNARIISRITNAWQWRAYSGSNPHDHHFHISATQDPRFYDDPADWAFNGQAGRGPVIQLPIEDAFDPDDPDMFQGAFGENVLQLQRKLQRLGFYTGKLDSDFGPRTNSAVKAFQRSRGLGVDGWVGPRTKAALKAA